MIEIVKADVNNIIEVAELVSRITQRHILEHFTEEGKRKFLARIERDVTQAMTHPNFLALTASKTITLSVSPLSKTAIISPTCSWQLKFKVMVWVNNFSIRY